ncbi:zf-HC2 domain-containing protein [Arthrobacter sp. STN4]|uniref:zf-HC2 domain-containing protein n=1 Tax=Arthrobacter sp. STN4 TaxID=2923276 RepID=UPI0035C0AAE4
MSTAERRDYEEHLAHCSACRRQVAGPTGMPGMLGPATAAAAVVLAGTTAAVRNPGQPFPGVHKLARPPPRLPLPWTPASQ